MPGAGSALRWRRWTSGKVLREQSAALVQPGGDEQANAAALELDDFKAIQTSCGMHNSSCALCESKCKMHYPAWLAACKDTSKQHRSFDVDHASAQAAGRVLVPVPTPAVKSWRCGE